MLTGVAATSSTNAWAVGEIYAPVRQAFILHWNGRFWARAPSPNGAGCAGLSSVAAISARSAWAVGATAKCAAGSSGNLDRTLILRWTGFRWRRVPSPL